MVSATFRLSPFPGTDGAARGEPNCIQAIPSRDRGRQSAKEKGFGVKVEAPSYEEGVGDVGITLMKEGWMVGTSLTKKGLG